MAITHVNTTQASDPSNGTVTVTKPTGVASGDVLVACLAQNEQVVTLPSGFVLVTEATGVTTTNTFSAHLYRKVCGGSEPANYTFSVGATGAPMTVVLSAWRGVDNTTPIDASNVIADGGSVEPSDPAISISPTNNNRTLFSRMSRSVTAIPTFTNGTAGWSELGDIGDFSGGSVRYGTSLFAKDADEGPGAKTEPAITCSTTDTDNVYVLFALRADNPSDTDTGSGTETTESIASTGVDSDSGSGLETELVAIPIADNDAGSGTEGAESVVIRTHHIQYDNFDRQDETSLSVSSSGAVWTSA